ncbi:GGDEF domain-containing protein [Metapseudomonas resinovorans]|uniref:diguanylate cyclase n=1 Tax=Metapseudomonas resinovorans NBRC 106553 TaxID=1245471 RepID=S6AH12_METRE|nr:GGDEF domain-containing protein [Pseudomonas resinovorans]BAN47485.1 putative GGDEF domain protein [Pseudomonas resinovorans NBRC 106553]
MFHTVEAQLSHQVVTPELRAEFRQHDFERLRTFCLLVFCVSIGLWFFIDVLVSFEGGQGFTPKSILFLALLGGLTCCVPFIRRARSFYLLNLLYVGVYCFSSRLVIEGMPEVVQPLWLTLTASSVVFLASVMPQNHYSYFGIQAVTWLVLNPFSDGVAGLELEDSLIFFYVLFFLGMTVYTYLRLTQGKLNNFLMARLLMEQAYLDALTRIPNRRAFISQTTERLEKSEPGQRRYLAMVDIDFFKKINDSYGHDIGDEVLQRVAGNLRDGLEGFEFARLGGEEFGIYLWDLSPEEAGQLMENLLRAVREAPTSHPATISIGLARLADGDTLNQALIKADQALYQSKHNGRDRSTYAP